MPSGSRSCTPVANSSRRVTRVWPETSVTAKRVSPSSAGSTRAVCAASATKSTEG